MKRIERILNKYGLGWRFENGDSPFEYFNKEVQQLVQKYHYEKISEEKMRDLVCESIDMLFRNTSMDIAVKESDKTSQYNEKNTFLKQVPSVLIREYVFEMVGEEVSFSLSFYDINRIMSKKGNEEYKNLFAKLEDDFSEEEKMKAVFDKKYREEILRKKLLEFVRNLQIEIEDGEMPKLLREDLFLEIHRWVKSMIRGPRIEKE